MELSKSLPKNYKPTCIWKISQGILFPSLAVWMPLQSMSYHYEKQVGPVVEQ